MKTNARAGILAFHAVEIGPGPLCLAPAVFARQVSALAEAGVVAFTVSELMARMHSGSLPSRAVAFTFDDGYESVHRHALPTLASQGYVATVLPVTSQLGGSNAWEPAGRVPELRLLARSQVVELRSAGWEIGGHTHTHRPLPGLTPEEVASELGESKRRLEDLVGAEVRCFAYPYGRSDPLSRRMAAEIHESCLGIGTGLVTAASPRDQLERVDAWYLRQPWQLSRLHGRLGRGYLAVRRAGRAVGPVLRS